MIAAIICILLALSVLGYWVIQANDDGMFSEVILGVLLAAITLSGASGVEVLISTAVPHHFTTERVQLAVLQDGTSLAGRFYLMSGVIDSKPTYTFYTKTGNA